MQLAGKYARKSNSHEQKTEITAICLCLLVSFDFYTFLSMNLRLCPMDIYIKRPVSSQSMAICNTHQHQQWFDHIRMIVIVVIIVVDIDRFPPFQQEGFFHFNCISTRMAKYAKCMPHRCVSVGRGLYKAVLDRIAIRCKHGIMRRNVNWMKQEPCNNVVAVTMDTFDFTIIYTYTPIRYKVYITTHRFLWLTNVLECLLAYFFFFFFWML